MKIQKKQEEKYKAVYIAALELIAEHGFHGAPVSQIAKRAGIAVGSIYCHFKDKEDMIFSLHRECERKLDEALAEPFKADGNKKEKFFAVTTALIKYLMDNPLELKFMQQFYNSPYGVELARDKYYGEKLEVAKDKPLIGLMIGDEFQDLPLPLLHSLAFGPAIFSVQDHVTGIQPLDEKLVSRLVEGCWQAVKK